MRRIRQRRERGSIVALAFVALVPLIAAIGGFAVDCMHFNDERGALQRATDAAALAGAEDLASWVGAPKNQSGSIQDPANEEVVNFALAVAKVNVVDGRPVVTDSTNNTCTVTASIPAAVAPNPMPTKCRVDATMNIRSMFSMLFGNFGQQVKVHSIAAATTESLNQTYTGGVYPLLLSFSNLQPGGLPAIGSLAAGSSFQFQIGVNALWGAVSPASDSRVRQAQDSFINHTGTGGAQPVKIGQSVPSSGGTLANAEQALGTLPAGTTLICPFVDDIATPQCVGFIAIKTGAPVAGPFPGAIFNGTLMNLGVTIVTVGQRTGEYDENTDTVHKNFIQAGKVVSVHLIE